jgi:hypothetical protein
MKIWLLLVVFHMSDGGYLPYAFGYDTEAQCKTAQDKAWEHQEDARIASLVCTEFDTSNRLGPWR